MPVWMEVLINIVGYAGFVGIAAPIRSETGGEINSSISLIFREEHFALFDQAAVGRILIEAASRISQAI